MEVEYLEIGFLKTVFAKEYTYLNKLISIVPRVVHGFSPPRIVRDSAVGGHRTTIDTSLKLLEQGGTPCKSLFLDKF